MTCSDQAEVDYYWNRLGGQGEESMCGWLKDRFGVWWQVVPADLPGFLTGDPEKAQRAMHAMMNMKKLDIKVLRRAYEGK